MAQQRAMRRPPYRTSSTTRDVTSLANAQWIAPTYGGISMPTEHA